MSDNFIGMGENPNPDVPDIPMGLGMELMQNPKAWEQFGRLTDWEKTELIYSVEGAETGPEAEKRVMEAIERLENWE